MLEDSALPGTGRVWVLPLEVTDNRQEKDKIVGGEGHSQLRVQVVRSIICMDMEVPRR